MSDEDMPQGLKILYDQLTSAAEFPGTREHNARNLGLWTLQLEALNSIMIQFYTKENMQEFQKNRNARNEIAGSKDYIISGYELNFEFLGIIASGYDSVGLLKGNEEGTRIIYDLFVQSDEYPREAGITTKSLIFWMDRLNALHSITRPYHTSEFLREYRLISANIKDAAEFYPSDRYLQDTKEVFMDWLGSLARLLQSHQLLVPENYYISDKVRRGQ